MKKILTKFKKEVIFLLLAIFLLVGYLIVSNLGNRVVWKPQVASSTSQNTVVYNSILDGLEVSSSIQVNPRVIGVMIDNHPDARPQSGLLEAKVIYESPVEGRITRYFALFASDQTVNEIGPVRSARPYFVDWLREYGGLYMHCGGSPDALVQIKSQKVFDLNEMYNGDYFWRDNSRSAPHNLYTSSELWNKFLSNKNSSEFTAGWKFGDLDQTKAESVKNVAIEYSPSYSVGWKYLADSGRYERSINDRVQKEGQASLLADSIIIQYVKSKVVDSYGRLEIDTSSQGDARLLRDGLMWRGSWKKENGRTRFYDLSGQEMFLKPGKIWVQIVPKEINIKIST